jgi:FKBP-type peptidyl-prolyl cis-trans isomerase 2
VTIATGDAVTFEYTGRLDDDGVVFDTSRKSIAEETGLADAQPQREYGAITVEVGAEQVIQGLDEGLVGLEPGETKTFAVPPEKAYGKWSDERVQEFETDELREVLGGKTPEEGTFLEAQSGEQGEVIDVDDDLTRVDFNSELAGETLEFDVEIVSID